MANSDKNIRIIPNRNSSSDTPFIRFTGQSNNPILLRVLDDNTLSFEGTAGQLLSINNNLSSGWIFAVSDISGIPSFRVNADGTIGLAEYSGNIGIGTAGITPPFKITAGTNTATSTATPLTASLGGTYSSTAGANPKLRLYYDGTNSSGFRYSNNQLESIARNTDDFVWYFGGTQKARLTAAGNLGLSAAGTVSSKLFLETNAAAQVGIVVKGFASQTGNLLELQDSTGAVKYRVAFDGAIYNSITTAGSTTQIRSLSSYGDGNETFYVSKGGFIAGNAILNLSQNTGITFGGDRLNLLGGVWVPSYIYFQTSGAYLYQTANKSFFAPNGTTSISGISVQSSSWAENTRSFGISSPSGTERSYFGGYGNLVINVTGYNSSTGWDATNLLYANIDKFGTYTGNLAQFAVSGIDRFIVGPNADTSILLGSNTAVGVKIKAATSQTGNLLEIQNSSSTILSFINPSGSFIPTTSGLALGGSSNRWNLFATSGDFNNTVSLSPSASTTELRFYELAANGVDYTAFKAPDIHAQSIIYTLPAVAPALNQVLTASSVSGGNVTLSWGAASSGTLSGGGTQYAIPMWTNTSSLGDSIITQNSGATQITVAGNFRATTKSFLIDHPSFADKLLEHGSLEGPEHGAYVRGRASGINYVTIQLPDYWKDLVEEDYSIYITPRCNCSLFVASQSKNSFKISRTGLFFLRKIKIEFDYYCVGDRKDQKLELVQDKV
jgi:hypothetical protein